MQLVTTTDDEGEGEPLVYVPGVDGTGDLLLGTALNLRRSFRLVRLRYRSEVIPSVGNGYHEFADAIVHALGEIGIERAILLAESFGVAVALQTALDYPDRVRALALVNGFARHASPWKLSMTRLVFPMLTRRLFRLGRRFVIPFGMLAPRRNTHIQRAMLELTGDYIDAAFLRRLAMISKVDLSPRLAELQLPVALFASDRDRIVSSVSSARAMAAVLPDATLEILSGAGHIVLPFEEEPWVDRLLALQERAN